VDHEIARAGVMGGIASLFGGAKLREYMEAWDGNEMIWPLKTEDDVEISVVNFVALSNKSYVIDKLKSVAVIFEVAKLREFRIYGGVGW